MSSSRLLIREYPSMRSGTIPTIFQDTSFAMAHTFTFISWWKFLFHTCTISWGLITICQELTCKFWWLYKKVIINLIAKKNKNITNSSRLKNIVLFYVLTILLLLWYAKVYFHLPYRQTKEGIAKRHVHQGKLPSIRVQYD